MIIRTAALLAPLVLPATLAAQLPTPFGGAGPRVGVMAGLNSSTFGGSDVRGASRRTGVLGGVYATLPLGVPLLRFRPELLYAQKGAKATDADITATIKLSYVELPLLVQLAVPSSGGLRPVVYAGPSFALRTGCSVEASSQGTTLTTGCTDTANDVDPGIKSFDVGGVIGGQLNVGVAGYALGVGARYTHGFTTIAKDNNVKNRSISVYGSLELPFGR